MTTRDYSYAGRKGRYPQKAKMGTTTGNQTKPNKLSKATEGNVDYKQGSMQGPVRVPNETGSIPTRYVTSLHDSTSKLRVAPVFLSPRATGDGPCNNLDNRTKGMNIAFVFPRCLIPGTWYTSFSCCK